MSTPTLLLIDVGNSRIKYWFHHTERHPLMADSQASAVAHSGCLPTDELRTQWHHDAQTYGAPVEIRISHVASTDLYEQLVALCAQLSPNASIRRIRTRAQHPRLTLGYDEQQMGSDRYAQILGAQNISHDRDHVVISAGTALTIDSVLTGGQHIGGVISAGLKLMRTALHQYTAQLPLDGGDISFDHAPQQTRDALASGVMLSAVGAVSVFVQKFQVQHVSDMPQLLFCGGDAVALMHYCQHMPALAALPMRHTPALCLLGLLEMLEMSKH